MKENIVKLKSTRFALWSLTKVNWKIIAALVLGFLIGGLVLLLANINPFEAYGLLFSQSLGKLSYITQMINAATPLILTGLSVMFAFRTGMFNIGAEGQFIMGGLGAVFVGYFLHLPLWLHVPLTLLAGCLAGGAWGAIAGWLKVRFSVNEVISTIMLNWIALFINNFLVKSPWLHRPSSESSYKVLDTARLDLLNQWKLSEGGRAVLKEHPLLNDWFRADISLGFIITLLIVWLTYHIINKTTLGYKLKAVGFNQDAAAFAGINIKRNMVYSIAIAGALAGCASAIRVMGITQEITVLGLMEGNGFDGIAVSLMGGNTVVGTVFAGLLFGLLKYGGRKLQILQAPSEIINIMVGVIVFFIAIPQVFSKNKWGRQLQKVCADLVVTLTEKQDSLSRKPQTKDEE